MCDLPENNQIFDEIEKARKDAISTLNSVQIKVDMDKTTNDSKSMSKSVSRTNTKKISNEAESDTVSIKEEELNVCGVSIDNDDDLNDHDEDDVKDNEDKSESGVAVEEDLHEDVRTIISLTGELMLKDYSALELSKKIPFTEIQDSTGNKKVVRKSTLLWLLVSNPGRLSSDRVERVKISDIANRAARVKPANNSTVSSEFQFFRIQEEITIGEWCLFHVEEQLVIRLILGFKYLSGKTIRDAKYSKQYAPVESPQGTVPRGIGVLGTWHKLQQESTNPCKFYENRIKNADTSSCLTTFNGFLDIATYVGTVEKPDLLNDGLQLKNFQISAVLEITSFLKKGN